MRDAIERSQSRELFQQGGAQMRAGQYDVNQQDYGRNLAVAGLTAPPLVQSGSSYTGQQQAKSPFSSKILPMLQSGASTAAAAL
jgi:hypothetical protein